MTEGRAVTDHCRGLRRAHDLRRHRSLELQGGEGGSPARGATDVMSSIQNRSIALQQWLPQGRRPQPADGIRLFCFTYAGGSSAVFQTWPEMLPGWVDVRPVQLPGRWTRLQERPLTQIDDVVRILGPVLASALDMPFAFFGHSMGSMLAYETARYLRRERLPLPCHLFLSGHRAPHLPSEGLASEAASDEALIEYLQTLGGTPPEVLGTPELMNLLLPMLRADFGMCRQYRWPPEPPLPCAITVCAGDDDEEGTEPNVRGWQEHTTRDLQVLRFPGGHFYLHTSAPALLHAIGSSLERIFPLAGVHRHW